MPRKPLSQVLAREDLVTMRHQGMTYKEIAKHTGYSARRVWQYARAVLPPELRRRQTRQPRQDLPASSIGCLLRCTRCDLQGSPNNPVDFVTRLCLWCRLEAEGISLPRAHEDGRYQRILEQELRQCPRAAPTTLPTGSN